MRLFSWPGITALACAAGGGFLAGKVVHRHDVAVLQICDGGELCDAPPIRLIPPKPVEEIDLGCPSSLVESFSPQSMEPPLADMPDVIHTVRFELPAGAPVGPQAPSFMPYLTDDGEPALLPPLGDAPLLPPPAATPLVGDPSNPIYQAVKRFIDNAVKSPEYPSDGPPIDQTEKERNLGAEWRRAWLENPPSTKAPSHVVTDKVPLGKPPVSEHPSAMTPEKSPPKPNPKADTTDVRPGDLSPKPNGN